MLLPQKKLFQMKSGAILAEDLYFGSISSRLFFKLHEISREKAGIEKRSKFNTLKNYKNAMIPSISNLTFKNTDAWEYSYVMFASNDPCQLNICNLFSYDITYVYIIGLILNFADESIYTLERSILNDYLPEILEFLFIDDMDVQEEDLWNAIMELRKKEGSMQWLFDDFSYFFGEKITPADIQEIIDPLLITMAICNDELCCEISCLSSKDVVSYERIRDKISVNDPRRQLLDSCLQVIKNPYCYIEDSEYNTPFFLKHFYHEEWFSLLLIPRIDENIMNHPFLQDAVSCMEKLLPELVSSYT